MPQRSGRQSSVHPLVTPEQFLEGQGVDVNHYRLRKALLAFMSILGMQERFGGQLGSAPILSHTHELPLVRDDGAIVIGQVYGGPYCAIVLEELAVSGVQCAVGYGFSGTLDEQVAPGSIMVADSAFCSDGTSRQYTRDSEVHADPEMLDRLGGVIRARGINAEVGSVWTTDALYREFPSKVGYWRNRGARLVNLETASFYTVARSVGVRAVYLSVVSDTVYRDRWSGWSPDLWGAVGDMWDIALEMAETL